jgi:hypothetical protein
MKQALLPKKSTKGAPPAAAVPQSNNLQKKEPSALKQVNFPTTFSKRLEISVFAKERGMTVGELLTQAFDEYKANNL